MDTQNDNFSITSVHKKKLRFNEENIRSTLHPTRKEYGFMQLGEAQTPYPRHSNPVQSEALRNHLEKCLARANQMLRNDQTYVEPSFSYNSDDPRTPVNSWASFDEEQRHEEFVKKRKQYNLAEFIIAQQKIMDLTMPEPGPSIGDNWHIRNKDANAITYKPPPTLTCFIDNKRTSGINYETLSEVIKHASQCQVLYKE